MSARAPELPGPATGRQLIERLVRPEIRSMQGYSSARMEAQGGELLLNANEMPWPPFDNDDLQLNRYPEPQPATLITSLADYYNVEKDQLLLGRGSDEMIDLLVRAFCRPGVDSILNTRPGFSMYEVSAHIQGAEVRTHVLHAESGFELNPQAVMREAGPNTKLIFVCSPGNPTGNLISEDSLVALCKMFANQALVVVDEAYQEFAAGAGMSPLVTAIPNLTVLRTFSKAFALAGTRFGLLIGQPAVIAMLRKIQAPYPLPSPTTNLVERALTKKSVAEMATRIDQVVNAREVLAGKLKLLPQVKKVYPSHANFLLVRFEDGQRILNLLSAQGIHVRQQFTQPGLEQCLRITVGTEQQNHRLLVALGAIESTVENNR